MKVFLLILLTCGIGHCFDKSESKIVGGQNADEGAIPYQVSLRTLSNFHFCGGSILSTRTILTAAHCVVRKSASSFIVIAGTNYRLSGGVTYSVGNLIIHPNYNTATQENDIALVIVNQDITFTDKIAKISLPQADTIQGWVTLTGWGATSFPNGAVPNALQIIQLLALPFSACQKILGNVIYPGMICTYTKWGQGACVGDSGGPLVSEGTQIGVVSWGYPCGIGYPDIYTRVFNYVPWITATMI